MWKPNKTMQLFINGEEYDFDRKFSFDFHPINFSTMTFNNVIAKNRNNNIDRWKVKNINREFSFAEVKQNNQTIFFGIINDTGRLSLFPNSIKDFSITITDFRKWLSLTPSINKIWFKKKPSEIIVDVLGFLGEKKIKLGKINLTNDEAITAYSSQNKNAFQILKEVIQRQANSLMYFTFNNDEILVNFKSNKDLEQTSNINLNAKDINFLQKYLIEDIEFENSTNNYANFLSYSSDNVVSNQPTTEVNLPMDKIEIFLKGIPIKIENDISKTFIVDGDKKVRRAIILNQEGEKVEGKYYDALYSTKSNSLKLKEVQPNSFLTITYYQKLNLTFQLNNQKEIGLLSSISNTRGLVSLYEKFNDLTDAKELLRSLERDLEVYSSPTSTLILTSNNPIWDLTELVNVFIDNNSNLNGKYLVHQINGECEVSGDVRNIVYTYTLKQTKDFNNLVNKFDNQSYRSNPVFDEGEDVVIEDVITKNINLTFETKNLQIDKYGLKPLGITLNTELNRAWNEAINPTDKPKYKLVEI